MCLACVLRCMLGACGASPHAADAQANARPQHGGGGVTLCAAHFIGSRGRGWSMYRVCMHGRSEGMHGEAKRMHACMQGVPPPCACQLVCVT